MLFPNLFAKPFTNNNLVTPVGYNVSQINEIYGYNKLSYGEVQNGPEINICIIIAYSYPNLQSDLDEFCSLSNIPSTTLNIVTVKPNTVSSQDWIVEICLDTQWAHAICPYAKITVVEAASASLSDLLDAIQTANNLTPKPNIVNMSWGFPEFPQSTDIDIFDPTILYIAASGDDNYLQWPSTSPNVLCVSATTLITNNNTFVGETTWSNNGCGPSVYFPIPNYQKNNVKNITGNNRLCSDISIDGNPITGCYIYSQGEYFIVGGTSLSAPIIAGTMAIIFYQRLLNNNSLYDSNQNSKDGIQNILYNLLGNNINIYNYIFYDVTKGNSGIYQSGLQYDYPTGLGSPNIPTFVPYLINNSITPTYQVQVNANSLIEYENEDLTTGSASCIVTANATSSDFLEKSKIEENLSSYLKETHIPLHLLGLVNKENIKKFKITHDLKIENDRI
jgi:subtilase family serine protease